MDKLEISRIKKRFLSVAMSHTGLDEDEIDENSDVRQIICDNNDEWAFIEFLASIEREFRIPIPYEVAEKINSANDFTEWMDRYF